METLDEWLVAIHIICAVLWLGGAFVTQLYVIRAQGGAIPLGSFYKEVDFVGLRTFMPASLILLGTGRSAESSSCCCSPS